MNKLFSLILAVLLLLSSFIYSCNSKTFYQENGNQFTTNSIKLAQKHIPYQIVLPSYLPSGIDPSKPSVIFGPTKNALDNDSKVEIYFYYGDLLGLKYNYYISIAETNEYIEFVTSSGFNPVFLEINDTGVLYESSDNNGFSYSFHTENLSFRVTFFSKDEQKFSSDDRLKVVKSVIEKAQE